MSSQLSAQWFCDNSCTWAHDVRFLIKTNVATDEGNSRNEMEQGTNDEIGVAVQSWL